MSQHINCLPDKSILTLILEDYFQVGAFRHLIPSEHWGRFDARLQSNTDTVLALLAQHGHTATFFCCGWIAEHYPELLQQINQAGHEIGCQGYMHYPFSDTDRRSFRQDVIRSRAAVEAATGQAVHGFRIGRGWIGQNQLWALDVLAELGFQYDSSMCRTGRHFYQEPERGQVHQVETASGSLIEVPVSSWNWGPLMIPVCGGNYLRQFPAWLMQQGVDHWVSTHTDPLVLYFHLWELDPDQPQIKAANWIQRLRHYRNLGGMTNKIHHYLSHYSFCSIRESLQLNEEQLSEDQLSEHSLHVQTSSKPVDGANEKKRHQGRLSEPKGKAAEKVSMSLIIPCFNEEDGIPYLHKTLKRFAEKTVPNWELRFILIDDGSSDNTWTLLQEWFGHEDSAVLLQHPGNQGIGAAIITGMSAATSDLVTVLDADCTFSPEQLPAMLELLDNDVDIVSASPAHHLGAMRNVPYWRTWLSKGSAFCYRQILHHSLTSYTSCFRIYRRHCLQNIAIENPGFCGVTELLARLDLAGYRVREYPAVLETRLLGQSKINVARTLNQHLQLLSRLALTRLLGHPLPTPRFSIDSPLAVPIANSNTHAKETGHSD